MGINRVELATGETLIDLSEDTVTSDLLAEGATAHDANGDPIPGTFPISEVDTQADLINQIKTTLAGKSAGSGTGTGGENVSDVFWVTGEFDLSTMQGHSFSHTTDEIITAYNDGKLIELKLRAEGFGEVFAPCQVIDTITPMVNFGGFLYVSTTLYYVTFLMLREGVLTRPLIVTTTDLTGASI